MNDLWFVTFGDSRLNAARTRIRHQAEGMGVFGNRIRIFSESDLDRDFCEKMKDHLVLGSRGFGYWCWKPQIILQVMREMTEGDVLLYCDIGCHLNPRGLKRLEEYRQYAIEHGIVAFQSRALGEAARTDLTMHFLPERQWTKMDLFQHFRVADRHDILDSGQIGGTIVAAAISTTRQLMEEWRECFYEHFELLDDSPSKLSNAPDFIESRHDQSAFSVLCKKNNVFTLSSGEFAHIRSYMPEGGDKRLWPEYWRELAKFPVHARRDLGRFTKLVECPDWLKPILGKRGRRYASHIYEILKNCASPLIRK